MTYNSNEKSQLKNKQRTAQIFLQRREGEEENKGRRRGGEEGSREVMKRWRMQEETEKGVSTDMDKLKRLWMDSGTKGWGRFKCLPQEQMNKYSLHPQCHNTLKRPFRYVLQHGQTSKWRCGKYAHKGGSVVCVYCIRHLARPDSQAKEK